MSDSPHGEHEPFWVVAQREAIAAVERQAAEWEARRARASEERTLADEARQAALDRRSSRRTQTGAVSVRFSIRLSPSELDALERRADLVGLKPSGLARNLIRNGLTSHGGHGVDGMVGELELLTARLRAAVL